MIPTAGIVMLMQLSPMQYSRDQTHKYLGLLAASQLVSTRGSYQALQLALC